MLRIMSSLSKNASRSARAFSVSAASHEPAATPTSKKSTAKKPTKKAAPAAAKKAVKKAPKAPSKAAILEKQLNSKKALLKLPKGPASPFALFVSETSEAVMSKQQGAGSIAEITRVASQNWKALGESDKQRYQSKYEGLRANHEETLRQWWATADRSLVELENKRRRRHNKNVAGGAKGTKYQLLKDPFAPKRPGSAYLAFYKEKLAALGSISRDELLSQSKITASQWKSLSDAEKAPYVQQAAAEAEKYKQDMAQYNASRAA